MTLSRAFSPSELERAQDIYDLVFPPDLIEFLSQDHPLETYDWRTDNQVIREMLRWPADGLIFDVEHDALWLSDWGPRPEAPEDRAAVVRAVVAAAPKLIPVFSHRYISAEPAIAGNPVFSVYQSDIVIYGADLADYVDHELNGWRDAVPPKDIRRIRFWSHLVDLNNSPVPLA